MQKTSFYLFDWLSFTSKIHSPANIIALLGLRDASWQEIKGARGYRDRLYYDCVSIHYNGREDMGVWCELSGQGCRVFETLGRGDWFGLMTDLLYDVPQVHFTRIDLAFDDHDGLLPMDKLFWDTAKNGAKPGDFVSRFDDWEALTSSRGMTVNHGRKGSDVMIRIYDKAAERGLTDGSHWVRVELQLRDERALAFVRRYEQGGAEAVAEVFLGVVNNYLRYVEPKAGDDNRWRWPLKDYWAKFLDGAGRVRLFKQPGTEYNLGNLENFVVKQAGNAISAYLDIKGVDTFLEDIRKRGTCPNPKYEQLRREHGKKRK